MPRKVVLVKGERGIERERQSEMDQQRRRNHERGRERGRGGGVWCDRKGKKRRAVGSRKSGILPL